MTAKDVRRKKLLRTIGLHFSGVDTLKALGMYLLSVMGCLLLRSFDMHNDTSYVAMIFLLDVFLTAFWTDGYLLGIIAAVVGVFSVDYIFTYPFWHISFTLTGFPLTFLVMMTISILTATVTSRAKQMEQIRRDAEREKMYADLLRAVSHDIRTPLTGIVGATNVLLEQDGTLTQEQREQLLRSTNEDAQWLIRMVENLLSVTRIDGAKVEVVKTPTVLDELIDSVLMKFSKKYPNQKVITQIPEEFVDIPMDSLLIEQVLLNLLENAVFHAKGMTELTLSVSLVGDKAVFEVADNGCGIPDDALQKIFTGSYEKSAAPVDGTRSNMGIGLSVCAAIVKAHGSEITAENRKGGGAVFRFALERGGEDDGQ